MSRLLLLVLLPALAAAGLHQRSPLQNGWATQHGLTFKIYQPFKFSIYLQENAQGLSQLKQHALSASTPTDPLYGDHLTFEQINALTAPSSVAWEAVSSWLSTELPAANVTSEGSHFDIVSSVSDVSQFFATQFEVLVNSNTQQTVLRANAYTVPLWKIICVRCDDFNVLLVKFHHCIGDGSSGYILTNDVMRFYRQFEEQGYIVDEEQLPQLPSPDEMSFPDGMSDADKIAADELLERFTERRCKWKPSNGLPFDLTVGGGRNSTLYRYPATAL